MVQAVDVQARRLEGWNSRRSNQIEGWLVAKEFSQVKGISYQEPYSPVLRHEFLRILLGLITTLPARKCNTKQHEVKNAFLNGTHRKAVLTGELKGFGKDTNSILELKKSLYGLYWSPRERNQTLS